MSPTYTGAELRGLGSGLSSGGPPAQVAGAGPEGEEAGVWVEAPPKKRSALCRSRSLARPPNASSVLCRGPIVDDTANQATSQERSGYKHVAIMHIDLIRTSFNQNQPP